MVASWLEPTVEMVKTPTVEVAWAMVAGRGCQTSTGATPLERISSRMNNLALSGELG